MDLQEIGINAGNWVVSAQDRDCWRTLGNAALNLRVTYAMELSGVTMSFESAVLLNLVHEASQRGNTC